MKRRSLWLWSLFGAVLLGGGLLLLGQELTGASSTLSRDAHGWLGASTFLQARGVEVAVTDRPLTDAMPTPEPDRALVLALPFRQSLGKAERGVLARHLQAGGTIVLAYDRHAPREADTALFESLGLELADGRPEPPLLPWRWWRFEQETWTATPEGSLAAAPPLVIAAPRRVPHTPAATQVLYRGGDDDVPLVFAYRRHSGRVVVVPADAFSNGRLRQPGHGDLLASLAAWLGRRWTFDEYHHGLRSAEAATLSGQTLAWDLFAAHLLLLYGLAVLALGRRFGPVWHRPAQSLGSAGAFLRNLGALHRRLGHHDEAAERLLARMRILDPATVAAVDEPTEKIGDKELLALARAVAAKRAPRSKR